MLSSQFGSEKPLPSSQPASEHHSPAPEPSPDDVSERSLLDEVLSQTEASFQSGQPEELSNLAEFFEVARRYPNKPLVLEPIGIELVQAALKNYFQKLNIPSEKRRKMIITIACTLFEDPVTRERLKTFWNQLSVKAQ